MRQLPAFPGLEIHAKGLARSRAIAGKQHEPTSPGKRPIVIRGKLAGVSRVGQAVHLEFGGRIGIASPFRRETLTLFSLTVQRGRRQSRKEGSPGSAHSLMVAGKRLLSVVGYRLSVKPAP